MNQIKKTLLLLVKLFFAILLFGHKIVLQINLPSAKVKGNVLSSLFIFFVGVVDKISYFDQPLFYIPDILRSKYSKRTILLVASILFFLSLIEQIPQEIFRNNTAVEITTSCLQEIKTNFSTQKLNYQPVYSIKVFPKKIDLFLFTSKPNSLNSSENLYVFNGSYRI